MAVGIQVFTVLLLVFLMMLPLPMTAVGPLTVRVVDADKDPVANACVTEVWPVYAANAVPGATVDTVSRTASATLRADSAGLVRFPPRTATASVFVRIAALVPRVVSRLFGGPPRPRVLLTVLGPGYQGRTADLTPTDGVVSLSIRADVQAPALRTRLSRSCIGLAVAGKP
jgi:hypothetical protein